MKKSFKISFVSNEVLDTSSGGKLFKYSATVTIMSRSLGLFKVTNIHKCNDSSASLSDTFYLTNYPLENNKVQGWIDPISRSASNFLNIVGEKIEVKIRPRRRLEELVAVDSGY